MTSQLHTPQAILYKIERKLSWLQSTGNRFGFICIGRCLRFTCELNYEFENLRSLNLIDQNNRI